MCLRSQIIRSFAIALATFLPVLAQESTGSLNGRVVDNQYISPIGAFRVAIPVLAVLGGSITDTENVVTFQDRFNTHQSIACFKLDSTQRFEDDARGRKDYLIWFFANFVQADFEQRFHGARIESAHFLAELQAGSLLVYNLLPGGSMFAGRVIAAPNAPLIAKRGNLLFVRKDHIFVLSIELAEKTLEGTLYNKTVEEEDALLRKRLTDLLSKITFTDAPSSVSTDDPKVAK